MQDVLGIDLDLALQGLQPSWVIPEGTSLCGFPIIPPQKAEQTNHTPMSGQGIAKHLNDEFLPRLFQTDYSKIERETSNLIAIISIDSSLFDSFLNQCQFYRIKFYLFVKFYKYLLYSNSLNLIVLIELVLYHSSERIIYIMNNTFILKWSFTLRPAKIFSSLLFKVLSFYLKLRLINIIRLRMKYQKFY